MAEGGGFEPPIPVSQYNGLANRRLQPLGHPSSLVPLVFSRSQSSDRSPCAVFCAVFCVDLSSSGTTRGESDLVRQIVISLLRRFT